MLCSSFSRYVRMLTTNLCLVMSLGYGQQSSVPEVQHEPPSLSVSQNQINNLHALSTFVVDQYPTDRLLSSIVSMMYQLQSAAIASNFTAYEELYADYVAMVEQLPSNQRSSLDVFLGQLPVQELPPSFRCCASCTFMDCCVTCGAFESCSVSCVLGFGTCSCNGGTAGVAVPTLPAWGLGVMLLSLVATGSLLIRRTKSSGGGERA